jgi:hypothetical protein
MTRTCIPQSIVLAALKAIDDEAKQAVRAAKWRMLVAAYDTEHVETVAVRAGVSVPTVYRWKRAARAEVSDGPQVERLF